MRHGLAEADLAFRRAFESGAVAPADFDHRGHVRLAYVYLCELSTDEAHDAMKRAILGFLQHLGADPAKYHETITRAWIMAVRHFMERSQPCESAAQFIERNPELLDAKIMLTHYSAQLLFSDHARAGYVEPDLEPIPRHP